MHIWWLAPCSVPSCVYVWRNLSMWEIARTERIDFSAGTTSSLRRNWGIAAAARALRHKAPCAAVAKWEEAAAGETQDRGDRARRSCWRLRTTAQSSMYSSASCVWPSRTAIALKKSQNPLKKKVKNRCSEAWRQTKLQPGPGAPPRG